MKIKHILSIILFFTISSGMAQVWQTDIDKSLKIAHNENKKVVIVFQGSDWCAPCIKLDRGIWQTKEFINYAKENFVMLKVDFPRRKKNKLSKEQEDKNILLAEKYNKESYFPYIVILDKEGKQLGFTSYKKLKPKEYIKLLESF